jgi:hypothetical protein
VEGMKNKKEITENMNKCGSCLNNNEIKKFELNLDYYRYTRDIHFKGVFEYEKILDAIYLTIIGFFYTFIFVRYKSDTCIPNIFIIILLLTNTVALIGMIINTYLVILIYRESVKYDDVSFKDGYKNYSITKVKEDNKIKSVIINVAFALVSFLLLFNLIFICFLFFIYYNKI